MQLCPQGRNKCRQFRHPQAHPANEQVLDYYMHRCTFGSYFYVAVWMTLAISAPVVLHERKTTKCKCDNPLAIGNIFMCVWLVLLCSWPLCMTIKQNGFYAYMFVKMICDGNYAVTSAMGQCTSVYTAYCIA